MRTPSEHETVVWFVVLPQRDDVANLAVCPAHPGYTIEVRSNAFETSDPERLSASPLNAWFVDEVASKFHPSIPTYPTPRSQHSVETMAED